MYQERDIKISAMGSVNQSLSHVLKSTIVCPYSQPLMYVLQEVSPLKILPDIFR
jgi:hypothetical protein